MRTSIVVLMLVGLAGAAFAAEPTPAAPSPRDRVIGTLSWIDSRPEPALFRENDGQWYPILMGLIDDGTVAPFVRRRALLALQWSPRREASDVLRRVATDASRDQKLRARALRCLARRDGVAAQGVLTSLLDDANPRVRKDTLLALAGLGVPGRAPIRAHLEREPEAWLRALARDLLGPDVAPTPGSR